MNDSLLSQAVTYAVNSSDGQPLTAEDVFEVLIEKARDARRYVPGCTACEIVQEHSPVDFTRRATIGGEEVTERVRLYAPFKVRFVRQGSNPDNFIDNLLSQGPDGLLITFASAQDFGAPPDSAEAQSRAGKMADGYGQAIALVLEEARRRALQTAPLP